MNQIGKTIIEQINASQIRNEPYLRFFKVLKTTYFLDMGNGISFDVKGDKFEGVVEVLYDEGQDLYQVALYKKGEPVYCVDGIYFDQLAELIWNQVVYV